MDNLTHTVVGLAVGAVIHRSFAAEPTPATQQTRHRLLLTACAAASNFPDLDLFLVKLLPDPLGYLLHHRGHTHTLLLEIPQALMLLALLWLLWPNARELLKNSAGACRALVLAVMTGFLLHIGMDFMNSYGVHPFYPFDMRWFFGDLVFIIEPVFWAGAGIPLVMTIQRAWLRWLWTGALAAAMLACAALGYLHWASLVLLAGIGLLAAAAGRLRQGNTRAGFAVGLGLCVAFIGVQALGASTARALLIDEMAVRAPGAHLVDAALTAYPANPLCWNYAAIERDTARDDYHVRRGVISLAAGVLAVTACPTGLTGAVRAADGANIGLLSDNAGSLQALRQRAATDCWLGAWLRFSRIPLLEGEVASDLRFGTSVAPNFSTIDLAHTAAQGCPAPVPPWSKPRADLLD